MTSRYSEPTEQQLQEARARIFLAGLKKDLLLKHRIRDIVLELEVVMASPYLPLYRLFVYGIDGGLIVSGVVEHDHGPTENVARKIAVDIQNEIARRRPKTAVSNHPRHANPGLYPSPAPTLSGTATDKEMSPK